jgi:hypothetical protein
VPDGVGYNLRDRDGNPIHVSEANLASAINAGATIETEEEGLDRAAAQGQAELQEAQHGGIGGAIGSVAAGGLRGLSFGASDVAQVALGGDAAQEQLNAYKELHPTLSTVSEIGGALGGAVFSGGTGAAGTIARGTVAGKIANVGTRIAEAGAERGIAARVAGAAAGGALEGGAQNLGSYISDVALGNKKLSAEGAIGAGLDGAMWGGAAGGALSISEKGLRSARKLFADADVTPATVARHEAAAAAEVDGAMLDADQASAALKGKVRRGRQARAEVDPDVAAHEAAVRAERLAQEQAKTVGAEGLARGRAASADAAELRLERARAKGAPKSAAGEVAAPLDAPTRTPSIDDSLEGLLGQTARQLDEGADIATLNARGRTPAADEAIESALDDAAAQADPDIAHHHALAKELDAAKVDVRDYARKLRQGQPSSVKVRSEGNIRHSADAPTFEPQTGRTYDVTAKHYDAEGNAVADAVRGDASVQWDRPRPLEPDELAQQLGVAGPVRRSGPESVASKVRADYDTLIKRAARTTDDAERQALITEASDLESRAFDVSSPEARDVAIGARFREGTSGPELARRRVELAQKVGKGKAGVADMSEQAIGDLVGADDALADMEHMIMAFRRYEDAERAVVQALGPEAPAGMARRAAAHEEALATRQGAEMSQTAHRAEEIAKHTAPEHAAQIAARAGDVAPGVTGSAPAAQSGAASMAADAAAIFEILGSAGVPGIPRAESIPVIGPMLGYVLKARAALMAYRKFGGRVPATAEGEIAKRAAATRNRIRGAVRGMLDAGAAVVTKAQRPAPIAAVLASKLFDSGPALEKRKRQTGEPESDVGRLYAARADEIVRSQAVGAIPRAVNQRLNVADPEVRQAVIDATVAKMSFLASKLPGGGMLPSVLPSDDPEWIPDRASIETFARYVEGTQDPAGVIERALDGHLSLEGVEALEQVYPELFREAQLSLLERAGEISKALPYRRKEELSVMFKVPLDATMAPDYIAAMAKGYQEQAPAPPAGPQPGQPPMPALAGPVNVGERAKMPLDRISQR